jgi:hypothetical protein
VENLHSVSKDTHLSKVTKNTNRINIQNVSKDIQTIMQGIIYLITNKKDEYKFIGSSTLPMNKVWQYHIAESLKMSPLPLHREFRRIGLNNFNIKVIDECHESLLKEKELYWIEKHKSNKKGYNEKKYSRVYNEHSRELFIKHRYKQDIKIQGTHTQTKEIKVWDSVTAACIELTGNVDGRSNILKTARKSETHQCYGYYWKLLEDKRRNKAVYGIDKKNSALINSIYYKSIDEAVKAVGTGRSKTGINKSLRNPGVYSWRGYYWYYLK